MKLPSLRINANFQYYWRYSILTKIKLSAMSNKSLIFIGLVSAVFIALGVFIFSIPDPSTNNFYNHLRAFLELLYFTAGIFLSVTILINLKQLKTSKEESQLRFNREAATLTVRICDEFAAKALTESVNVANLKKLQLSIYGGALESDFSHNKESRKWLTDLNDAYKVNNAVSKELASSIARKINYLNVFALYFTSRICNEEIAFEAHGIGFCKLIERYYPIIVHRRQLNHLSLQSLVDLYHIWKPKLEREKEEYSKSCNEAAATSR